MLEFARFQQHAKTFSTRLYDGSKLSPSAGCFSFFSAVVTSMSNVDIDDARVIDAVAACLGAEYDRDLRPYFKTLEKTTTLSNDDLDFEQFKLNILIGIYVMKWFKYNNLLASYMNAPIIELFKTDLQLTSLDQIDKNLLSASLTALSNYSTFIFHNKDNNETLAYGALNQQFGESIKVDIDTVSRATLTPDNSVSGLFYGVRQSIGL